MKLSHCLALLAIGAMLATASAHSVTLPSAERKLAFAPDYKGPLCADMLCGLPEDPVCGSDDVTYSNECELGIATCNYPERNITMVSTGACPETKQSAGYNN